MAGRGRGRPDKGQRAALTVRPPVDHMAVYREMASAEGVDVSVIIARAAAEKYELELPDWLLPRDQREQLAG